MKILGVSAHYHDSAAALLVDGQPVCAVEEERLSRRKHDSAFPIQAIEWCLDTAGISPEALDAVVFYEKPLLKFERILQMALRAFPKSFASFPKAMKNSLGEKLWIKGIISSQLGIPGKKILFTEHHQAHAAAAFLTSPTSKAAILTADGVGEWATLTIGRGEREPGGATRIEIDREIRFPHSLGMFYSSFTAYLGFSVNEGEYKVMGLASYGKPVFADLIRKILRLEPDGAFSLDLGYFDYHQSARRSFSDRLIAELGPPRNPQDPLDPSTPEGAHYANVAASVQVALEDVLVALCKRLRLETGLSDLCVGGGVALNGCANARILRESGFDRVFVPPAPGDSGCALGAALYADRVFFGQPDRAFPDHPFWGPAADPQEIGSLAREDDLPFEDFSSESEDAVLDRLTEELAQGRVVGWMEGASEFGPRALGHRSILTSPELESTRDRLNREIKYREEFRPFAPAVPIEVADQYFELPPGGARLGRFMSGVFPVRPAWRSRLQAITHVDGTARVQTVERQMAPRFYQLLERFGARTGIPILLNTSFNLAGEPIVNSVREGYSTFWRSGIDLLCVGRYLVRKRAQRLAVALEQAVG